MDKRTPLISAIIPTYNKAHFLADAINSALNQTYGNIEVIVVDDGSTDNTREIAKSYGDKIKYFYTNNNGNANARNYGIEKARGEYIAFLDHDDIWYPERLEKLIGFLDKNDDFGAAISEIEFVDINCKKIGFSSYKDKFPEDGNALPYILENFLGFFSNMLIKKEVVSKIGQLDESLKAAADLDYFLRIGVEYKIALCDKPLLKYRQSNTSFSKNLFTKNRLQVISKFKRFYPEFSKKYENTIKNTIAKVNLSYADDLLFHRYIRASQEQILQSLHNHITFKALFLYFKSIIIRSISVIFSEYKDRGEHIGL